MTRLEQEAIDVGERNAWLLRKALGVRALSGNYVRHGMSDSDGRPRQIGCIIAPGFGHEKKRGRVLPGPSNIALADLIEQYPGIPVAAQFEVDDALQARGRGAEYRIGEPGIFCNTRKVMERAVNFMLRECLLDGGKAPLLLGHGHHVPRADAALQALLPDGVEVAVPDGLQAVPWSGLRSSQVWTWGPVPWATRELISIEHFDRQGWLDPTYAAGLALEIV
jgi:hypothetical protein